MVIVGNLADAPPCQGKPHADVLHRWGSRWPGALTEHGRRRAALLEQCILCRSVREVPT